MAFTRFKYDEGRTKKELQQSTDSGRWVLNVPGNGDTPCYMEDPHIIPQKWGANLRTNTKVTLMIWLLAKCAAVKRRCPELISVPSEINSPSLSPKASRYQGQIGS